MRAVAGTGLQFAPGGLFWGVVTDNNRSNLSPLKRHISSPFSFS